MGVGLLGYRRRDLEQYAASYSGLMRIERLQFIADHCPPLRAEALKMALSFVQRTFNVDMYEEIHRKLSEATRELQNAPDTIPESGVEPPPLDTAWVEATRKKALLKLEKLDTDLKNYKGNSIKESIRRGHDDLGDHYLDCGDLSNALKCYSRARDYCTSAKHVINMCLNVIKVSVYLQNWSHVLSYVSKAESTPEIAEQRGERDSQTQAILTKLKCAAGEGFGPGKRHRGDQRWGGVCGSDVSSHCQGGGPHRSGGNVRAAPGVSARPQSWAGRPVRGQWSGTEVWLAGGPGAPS